MTDINWREPDLNTIIFPQYCSGQNNTDNKVSLSVTLQLSLTMTFIITQYAKPICIMRFKKGSKEVCHGCMSDQLGEAIMDADPRLPAAA